MFIKISFFHIISFLVSIVCISRNKLDIVTSFVTFEERPVSLLTPNLCWNRHELKSLAKTLSKSGISMALSFQQNRTEYYLQHIIVLADLSCPGASTFLTKGMALKGVYTTSLARVLTVEKDMARNSTVIPSNIHHFDMMTASERGYFKAPYRWLLLDDGTQSLDVLEDLEMLVDSDVVVARMGKDTVFVEVYKISVNSTVIYNTRLSWRPLSRESINDSESFSNKDKDDNPKNTSIIQMDSKAIQNIRVTTVTKYGTMEDYRESKVLSTRRMNLRRHTLTMANVITDSNETRKHMSDRLNLHQDSISKMSYMVVHVCFEMLNSTEKLIFTPTWGYRDNNGNWQGIVDHLLKKEADLGTLTIFTQERVMVIDYIAMVGSTAVRFVFREPPLTYISNIFTLPFSGAVWIAIFICILGCAVFLYITSKWEASMEMHPLQLDGSWADVLILVIGAVLQQGCTLEPRYAAGRCVTLLLFLSLTILYAAYSANIVVLLRAPSSSVRSLPDLLNSPLKFGASDFSYNRYFFKKLNDPIRKAIYDKKIAPKGKKPNFLSMKDGVERIRKGLFAFHMETNPGYRLIQETYQEDEKCDLVEIDYINEIDPWVPGQKRSPFKDLFKINFIKIRETGIQASIHHRLHVSKPRCSGTVSTFSSVGITDMYSALLATLYGMLLAPAVLMLEITYKRLVLMKHKRKLMQERFNYLN